MNKILEYIICDRYINKELEKKPNIEYYLVKFSQKHINVFSDKTYRFEFSTKGKHNIWIDSILDLVSYRLENLTDCKITINKLDKSILIEYNENNTFLFIKIINSVIENYLQKTYKETFKSIDLDKLISVNYITNCLNEIVILDNSTEIYKIEIEKLKEDLYLCHDIPLIGNVCGKILFDNVFNNSRSLKNKIDSYNYDEYLENLSVQRELTPNTCAKLFSTDKYRKNITK